MDTGYAVSHQSCHMQCWQGSSRGQYLCFRRKQIQMTSTWTMFVYISEFFLTAGKWVQLHNIPQYLYIRILCCITVCFSHLLYEVQWAWCCDTTKKSNFTILENIQVSLHLTEGKGKRLVIYEIKCIPHYGFFNWLMNFKDMKHWDFLLASAEAGCVQPFRKFQYYQFLRFCFLCHKRVYMIRWQLQLSLKEFHVSWLWSNVWNHEAAELQGHKTKR